jgi:hypothetical protein
VPPIIGVPLLWIIICLWAVWVLRGEGRQWRKPWVVPVVLTLFAVGGIIVTVAGLADGSVVIAGHEVPDLAMQAFGTLIMVLGALLPGIPRLAGEDPKEPMRRIFRHYDRIRELAADYDMAGVSREARAMRRAGNRELAELVRLLQADVDDFLAQREKPAEESAARGRAMSAEIRAYGARHGIPPFTDPAPLPNEVSSPEPPTPD